MADIARNTPRDITVFDELKQRFLEALESENERIRGQVERESAGIIAEAEQEAKRIAEEIVTRAKEESKRIIDEGRQRAQRIVEEEVKKVEIESSSITAAVMGLSEQIIGEAERFARDVSTLRLKLESEAKNAQERAKQQANVVTDAAQKVDNIVVAKDKLQRDSVEHVAAVSERKPNSTHDTTKEAENTAYVENGVPPHMHGRKKVPEQNAPAAKQPNTRKANDDKPFVGTLEFSITGGPNSAPLQGLLNHLTKTHGIEVLSTNRRADGVTKVVVIIRKPIPILKILKQMASVDDAYEADKAIQIKLAIGPAWVG